VLGALFQVYSCKVMNLITCL